MATIIGEIDTKKCKQIYEETYAEWRISEFFSVSEYNDFNFYDSPTFCVTDVPFFLRLFPRTSSHPESATLYLHSKMHREFSIKFNFGLKKLDGSMEQLKSGTMKGKEIYAQSRDIVLSEVIQRKSELVPNDVLTVTCTLMPDIVYSPETTELVKLKPLKLISKC